MKSYAGRKRSGRHGTCIEYASQVMKLLEKCDSIKRISPGHITNVNSAGGSVSRTVVIRRQPARLLLTVRSSSSVQGVSVYADDLDAATRDICTSFKEAQMQHEFRLGPTQ